MSEIKMQLPEQLVEGIVHAEIARHLGNVTDIAAELIKRACSEKCECDSHRYMNSDRRPSRLVCEADRQLRKSAADIIRAYLAENNAALEKAIRDELKRPAALAGLARSVVAGMQAGAWTVKAVLGEGK